MNTVIVGILLLVFFIQVSHEDGDPKADAAETKDKTEAEKPAQKTEEIDKKDSSSTSSTKEKGVETSNHLNTEEGKKVKTVEKDDVRTGSAGRVDDIRSTREEDKVIDKPKKEKHIRAPAADSTSEEMRKDMMQDHSSTEQQRRNNRKQSTHESSDGAPPRKRTASANKVNEQPHQTQSKIGKHSTVTKGTEASTRSRFNRFTKFLKNMNDNLGEKLERLDDRLTDYTHHGLETASDRVHNTKQAFKDRLGIVQDSSSGSGDFDEYGYRKSDMDPVNGGLANI